MKKIPDNATKVFEGVIFDVYHWQQEMFDGSFDTFEAIKHKEGVLMIAVTENRIIINHEEQPGLRKFITLPGGNSETDDYLLDAKRELLEETGYESDDWQEWFVVDILKYHKLEWNNHVYIIKNAKKVQEQKLDPGEKIETHLITFEEFLELRNSPEFRNRDLIPVLEKAASNETEKQTLKNVLGITT